MGELSGLAVPERVRSALAAATTPEEEYETGMELTAEPDRDIEAGAHIIAGTARSMGITVDGAPEK